MNSVWFYSLLSVLIVSLISFIGIFTLGIKKKVLQKITIYLVSFSAGALLGDSFIHLLPELAEEAGFGLDISLYVLSGIVLFFVLEKFVRWQHCHGDLLEEGHVHSFAYMNLIGDGFHNLLDGMMIAASYLVSVPVGIATTIAVLLHEVPQEIGDFGVLIHGGFSRTKALWLNFASGLVAVVGAVLVFALSGFIEGIGHILIALTVGGFLYIAGSDLIPELNRHEFSLKNSFFQLVSFLMGIGIMFLLLVLLE